MKTFTRRVRKLTVPVLVVPLISAGIAVGAIAVAGTTPAGAAACSGTPLAAGSSCTDTGTLTLSGGTLTMTTTTSLTWAATLSGTTTYSVDTVAADQGFQVDDNTGSGSGWKVTVSATTFTTGVNSLADSGTFSLNGSTSSSTSTSAPTAACVTVGDCTVPTESAVTYPVAITTAASSPTAVTIYNAAANTGLGNISIGGSGATNPIGWWLTIPPTAKAGTYTSTVTLSIASGP
jgi:hypothetical protein